MREKCSLETVVRRCRCPSLYRLRTFSESMTHSGPEVEESRLNPASMISFGHAEWLSNQGGTNFELYNANWHTGSLEPECHVGNSRFALHGSTFDHWRYWRFVGQPTWHPSPNVQILCNFEPQILPEIITSRDAESACFKGSKTSCDVITCFFLPNSGRQISHHVIDASCWYMRLFRPLFTLVLTAAGLPTSQLMVCNSQFMHPLLSFWKKLLQATERFQALWARNPGKDP